MLGEGNTYHVPVVGDCDINPELGLMHYFFFLGNVLHLSISNLFILPHRVF